MIGNIHSIETMGMVDGPGIRYVLFTQGCLFRCQYCHNPDTWEKSEGKKIDSDEIVTELKSYLPYYEASGGGITVSGGEALLQAEFVLDLFRKCKEVGIHTALDTTGAVWNDSVVKLLEVTDLVLLDLKEMDAKKHQTLTACNNTSVLNFAKYLAEKNIPVWVRHVLVPGLTDDSQSIRELGMFIQDMKNIERVELLPFHKMGEYKWKQLDIPYLLSEVEPPTEDKVQEAYACLAEYISVDKLPGLTV